MKRLVVFDLDHTLLTVNSSFRFGFYLYRQKLFSSRTLLGCLWDYLRHKWLGMSVHALHVNSFERLFKGKDVAVMRRYVDQFLTNELTSFLYEPAIRHLKAAQERGDQVIILSSSPDFLVGEIARRLQVQNWKGTLYQMDEQGAWSAVAHVMDGQDKAFYLKQLAQQLSHPLSATVVYSDSFLDLPILNIAGKAIGVVPDRLLKQICKRNGWEIL